MKIIVRLKSGFELPITCEECEITRNGLGYVTNVNWKGIKDFKPLILNIEDIEVMYRDVREELEQ